MSKILLLNGPNLNLLGTREPEKYGTATLAEVEAQLQKVAQQLGHTLVAEQSNAEHILIEHIHNAKNSDVQFIIINAGAFSHTSLALRDALESVAIPFIEVHITNVYARESFRHHSYLSEIAVGVIAGLGAQGYSLALVACARRLSDTIKPPLA